jgi:hypothetical protein
MEKPQRATQATKFMLIQLNKLNTYYKSWSDGYFTKKILVILNIEMHIAFVDFKIAFDRVNTRKLLEILGNDFPQQIKHIQIYKMET